jgi:hypothetical protein
MSATGKLNLPPVGPPKPTIGRTVHYVHAVSTAAEKKPVVHWPAIITRVWSSTLVNLTVFPDGSTPFCYSSCPLDESGAKPSTWHWPEREN